MQLSFVTHSNEADRLRRSVLQLLSQPKGLTALAAANPLAPARSNRAAASVAWVFVMLSLTFHKGVMAVGVRQQLQVPHAAHRVMQPARGAADIPKRQTALLSAQKKHKSPQVASIPSEASTVPDFFQLDSDIEDNSSNAFAYEYNVPSDILLEEAKKELLEDYHNITSMYHVQANTSDPALDEGSSSDKQQLAKSPSNWPWVRLGKVVRKTNNTEEPGSDIGSYLLQNRTSLLKSGQRGKQQSGVVRTVTAIQRLMMPDHRFMALPLGLAFLIITAFVCLYLFLSWRFGRTTGVRAQVEALHLSTGNDIQELFQMKERYDCCHFQPISPGLTLRLQGTVTAGRQGKLVAPLSRQDCVHFSASASTKRHDGIHGLPVAFHSVCVDFTITLLDAPDIEVTICGQDVALFDSNQCVTEDQRRFSDSPDHWQDFILTHRAPGTMGLSSAALRSESGSLEFREVALITGAVVTCVGELRQCHDGVLRLFPCGEFGPERSAGDVRAGNFGERWRTSWEKPESTSSMKTPEKVLISDDKRLLKQKRKRWDCLHRHTGNICGRKDLPKEKVPDDRKENA